ncbi:methionyl-tRNA formyltransferase [Candidatus Endowatersipora endosymbiont of Watersipora subatra]|uniref:methionyl-tRNA formyltransferase n=1 Tax=Candidatus Endowatersipora endosymbiont of Watersipora subatra TaxID=3077946 RepID=UPI00312C8B73
MALRVIFMGSPNFSVPSLEAIIGAGHTLSSCYTCPPRSAGRRGLVLKKSSIHQLAIERGIEVRTPTSFNAKEEHEIFKKFNADVAIVVAYGMLLPTSILQITKLGCYNAHASLLPRWRGAAPIQRAIMDGDEYTGMTIIKMNGGLDTGPIALTEKISINEQITSGGLHDRLAEMSASLIVRALKKLEQGDLFLTSQPHTGVTYAKKISKNETRINWDQPNYICHRQIMGLSPFPGAWCEMKINNKPTRVKILRSQPVEYESNSPGIAIIDDELLVSCRRGAVRLLYIQKTGSKVIKGSDFLLGNSLDPEIN